MKVTYTFQDFDRMSNLLITIADLMQKELNKANADLIAIQNVYRPGEMVRV